MFSEISLQGDQQTWRVDGLVDSGFVDFGSDAQSHDIGPEGPPVAGSLGGWLLTASKGLPRCLLDTCHSYSKSLNT